MSRLDKAVALVHKAATTRDALLVQLERAAAADALQRLALVAAETAYVDAVHSLRNAMTIAAVDDSIARGSEAPKPRRTTVKA